FGGSFEGWRLRALSDLLTPTKPLRLRLQAGTLWSPTQSYFASYPRGGTAYGFNQEFDLTLGLSAALSALPRARFSPYVMLGVYARQTWSHGAKTLVLRAGSFAWNELDRSPTAGAILPQ